jgi:hypothetical protein
MDLDDLKLAEQRGYDQSDSMGLKKEMSLEINYQRFGNSMLVDSM